MYNHVPETDINYYKFWLKVRIVTIVTMVCMNKIDHIMDKQ